MNAIIMNNSVSMRAFIWTFLIVSIWVNISEVLRYFVFIMPMVREYLAAIPDVAPMNIPVFLLWAIWDSILVIMVIVHYWLCSQCFGASIKTAILAGTLAWLFFFVLYWVAMLNMNLASMNMLFIALPLAWFELVVACVMARQCFKYFGV